MVGQRLKQARKDKGRSLADVGADIGVSAATLSRIENGKQAIALETFLHLCSALQITPSIVLETDQEPDAADPIIERFDQLQRLERMRFWSHLASQWQVGELDRRRATADALSAQVEELLAQIEFVRAGIEAIQRRVNDRRASAEA